MTSHYYAYRFTKINLLADIIEGLIIEAYRERVKENPEYPNFNELEKNLLAHINSIKEMTEK